jgi:hypothetical protein
MLLRCDFVMPGPVPDIHVFLCCFFLVSFLGLKTWMAGIRPGHDGVETSVQASIATALPKARGGEHRSTAA